MKLKCERCGAFFPIRGNHHNSLGSPIISCPICLRGGPFTRLNTDTTEGL